MAIFCCITGRIGKIEIKEGQNGKYLSMNVATDIYSKGETNTMWIRVYSKERGHIQWAEKASVGSSIDVQGLQVNSDTWIDKKDGTARSQIVVIANVITYANSRGKKKDKPEEEQTPVSEELPIPPASPDDQPEDLPF